MQAHVLQQPAKTGRSAVHDHFVQFYDKDEALVPEVARFLRNGLESGSAAVMIATESHAGQVLAAWAREGFAHAPYASRGQLVMLDAADTLARLMVGATPDAALFDRSVGELVRGRVQRYGHVVAFGEMVALLCEDGMPQAALELEQLWNELARGNAFALYCAYPMASCAAAGMSETFRHLCSAHSHVVPVEGLLDSSEDDLVRRIVELQQKAHALENEVRAREQAEAGLQSRERELSDFLENAVVGLHRVGADGTILWANRAELEMLGYAPEEYIGRNIADFHADRGLAEEILDTLRRGLTLREQGATLVCKDGSPRHVLISSNALISEGKFISTRCFTRDVTDRWLAQEALRERTAILHLAMRAGRMGYWVGDLREKRIRCSQETAELLGLGEGDEVTLESFVSFLRPEDRNGFRDAFTQASGSPGRLNCRFGLARGAERRFEVRGEAIFDEKGAATKMYGVCTELLEPAT